MILLYLSGDDLVTILLEFLEYFLLKDLWNDAFCGHIFLDFWKILMLLLNLLNTVMGY